MQLFNTLTRKVDEVRPIDPPEVKIYTCGPTVYDHSHVGHWFNYVRMDLLIRTLVANKLAPKWIMNITDVGHLTSDADEGEDKLQASAARQGKTAWEIAEFYTKEFIEGMKLLNITNPTQLVKATDHIEDQIDLIKILEEKGYTYKIDDGIYYDTSKFPKYKDFARLDLDEEQSAERINPNPQKKHPSDFALWKFSPQNSQRDMEWDSPWGKGFPGWHIECSAMSRKYLGDTLDIHCGGIDHIPIHHTNEIAQSEAATGKQLANIWLHSNHVTVNGQKISKSLNNGITIEEVQGKGYSVDTLRLNILESHYRTQAKFSWDSLDAASNRLDDLRAMAAIRYQSSAKSANYDFKDIYNQILGFMSDDLNSPLALSKLSEISKKMSEEGLNDNQVSDFSDFLTNVDELLGLKLSQITDIDQGSKDLIGQREEARKNNDWSKADELREQLKAKNIAINDEPSGPRWQWIK